MENSHEPMFYILWASRLSWNRLHVWLSADTDTKRLSNHRGEAIDTITAAEKREYLVINDGREQWQIELNQLAKMRVLTPNANFKEVSF